MKKFNLGCTLQKSQGPVLMDLQRLISSRLLVMASSGGGKSWLLRKLIELFYGHIQIIILDVEGEFSSLRKNYDFVVAGKGADISAAPHLADALAQRALSMRFNLIADLYELPPRERILFVRRFLESMINSGKDLWHPVLVFLDEAHIFAPEQGSAESLNAVIDMASRGRKRGFCLIPATQRMSKFHKDVAAECQNKLIGLANIELDRKRGADELGFTNKQEVITLRDMAPGQFYAVGPAFNLHGVNMVNVDEPKTRPAKTGSAKSGTPAPTAKVKAMLAKLADLPKQVEQEAKTMLQLRTELVQAKNAKTEAERALKFLESNQERKIINQETMKKSIGEAHERGIKVGQHMQKRLMLKAIQVYQDASKKGQTEAFQAMSKVLKEDPEKIKDTDIMPPMVIRPNNPAKPFIMKNALIQSAAVMIKDQPIYGDQGFSPYELDILAVLNMKPGTLFSQAMIAAQSGRSKTSSAFPTAIRNLVAKGMAVKVGTAVKLADGVDASHLVKSGPTGINQWLGKLKGTQQAFLKVLLDEPEACSKERLCELAKKSPTSSGVDTAIRKLVTLGLAVKEGREVALNPEHRG